MKTPCILGILHMNRPDSAEDPDDPGVKDTYRVVCTNVGAGYLAPVIEVEVASVDALGDSCWTKVADVNEGDVVDRADVIATLLFKLSEHAQSLEDADVLTFDANEVRALTPRQKMKHAGKVK